MDSVGGDGVRRTLFQWVTIPITLPPMLLGFVMGWMWDWFYVGWRLAKRAIDWAEQD